MTSSPFLTPILARSPFSRRLPSPTARILPRRGFSLALSGSTMPLLVLLSASTRFTRILSPRGRSFAMMKTPSKKRKSCRKDLKSLISNRKSLHVGPLPLVIPSQDAGERVEQQVEIDRLAQHAEHVHAQRVAEQVRGQVAGEQDGGRGLAQLAHQPDHLQPAELG